VITWAAFSHPIDTPIVLEDDANHETHECAPTRHQKRGQELGRGYDLRIPIQLSNAKAEDVTVSDHECYSGDVDDSESSAASA
jgi:hypothetical protein